MAIDYSLFKFSKGTPRAIEKRQKRLSKEQQERECRLAVKWRDKGVCRIPGCKDRAEHLHHITYRSRGGKWQTWNIASLCPSHHHMVHVGKIRISGNADEELIVEGSRAALSFKL